MQASHKLTTEKEGFLSFEVGDLITCIEQVDGGHCTGVLVRDVEQRHVPAVALHGTGVWTPLSTSHRHPRARAQEREREEAHANLLCMLLRTC